MNYSMQCSLIEKSESTDTPLSSILENNGLSYNDLRYKNSYNKIYKGAMPKTLLDFQTNSFDVPVVSFFSGCGGLDLGFETAGFKHKACFEINELFCKTLRRNRPNWGIYGPPMQNGDVSKTDEIINTLTNIINIPFPGVFIGGPPCQPFSIAANQRFSKDGDNFKRVGFAHKTNGNLLFNYVELIIKFKPKVFLVENVPGLRDIDDGKQLHHALSMLSKDGYNIITPFTLDASHYGIAQQRIRLFIIGSRSDAHYLPPIESDKIIGCGSILCDMGNLFNQHNSEIRKHNASSVKRYAVLDYGQRDHLGRVDRLDPLLPSKTVIAGGTNGGGRSHLHPEIPRTLSVRECARLQTFPDDFVFVGPTARQFTQVGNAVPPVLAAQIALSIRKSFF